MELTHQIKHSIGTPSFKALSREYKIQPTLEEQGVKFVFEYSDGEDWWLECYWKIPKNLEGAECDFCIFP